MFRVFTLLSVLFLLACQSDKKYGNKQIFRYNEPGLITSLDPAFCRNLENIWAVNQLFSTLVRLDNNLQAEPCLAKSWDLDEKNQSYTFHLRQDVFFHRNTCFKGARRKFKAADVVYSFNRILDPLTASSGTWIFEAVARNEAGHAQWSAPNDSTFVIQLKKPFPAFLSLLAMQYASIVPHEAIEKYGQEFSRNPVGTGPFQFFIWEEGNEMVFHKNPEYFEKDQNGKPLPYLDAVSIRFLQDKNANFLALLKGDFDFLSGLDASYKDEIISGNGQINPAYQDRFYIQKAPFLKSDYLGCLLKDSSNILANVHVRKALNMAIDRENLIKYMRNGLGVSGAQGFVPQVLIKQRPLTRGYQYSLNEARKELTLAGLRVWNLPNLTLSTTPSGADICEFIQSEWQKLGFKVTVDILPEANHRASVANGQLSLFRKNWVADYPDAENFFSLFYSPNFTPNGPNYTFFKNSNFDKLYEQLSTESDEAERDRLCNELDKILFNDAPVIPLFYDEVIHIVNKRVKQLPINGINLLDLRYTKITTTNK